MSVEHALARQAKTGSPANMFVFAWPEIPPGFFGPSRWAASECSPGRKPGVIVARDPSPGRAKDLKGLDESCAPSGAGISSLFSPRAGARGYTLTPLRGWDLILVPPENAPSEQSVKSAADQFPLIGNRR